MTVSDNRSNLEVGSLSPIPSHSRQHLIRLKEPVNGPVPPPVTYIDTADVSAGDDDESGVRTYESDMAFQAEEIRSRQGRHVNLRVSKEKEGEVKAGLV